VLVAAFALSAFLTFAATRIIGSGFADMMGIKMPASILVNLWAPPIFIGLLLALAAVVIVMPGMRRSLRWRVPAFKEAKLAQLGSAMGLMLKHGSNLDDALGIVEQMEQGTPASPELAEWHRRLAQGRGQFAEMAAPGPAFPPLFLWLVANAGEDLAAGFGRAGDIYNARAIHRTEMFLYAALPFTVLALGAMILCQLFPIVRGFIMMLNGIGS